MEKDIEIAHLTASIDTVIDQLKEIFEGSGTRHRMSFVCSSRRSERFEEDHG
jgi:hypothetical protein